MTDSHEEDSNIMLPTIGDIYRKIIDITYATSPPLLSDIRDGVRSRVGYSAFIPDRLITINRFDRFDTTLPLIRKQLPISNYDKRSDSLLHRVMNDLDFKTRLESELKFNNEQLDSLIEQDLATMELNIRRIDNDQSKIDTINRIRWNVRTIALKYIRMITTDSEIDFLKLNTHSKGVVQYWSSCDLSNPDITNLQIFTEVWAMSLILPLHSWILHAMNIEQDSRIHYVLGEFDNSELEYMLLSLEEDNRKEMAADITREYQAHSVVWIMDDRTIYLYDPDDLEPIKEQKVFGRNVRQSAIDQPIQEVTDDIYCTFHSLFCILDVSVIHSEISQSDEITDKILDKILDRILDRILDKILDRFEEYQNSINNSGKTYSIVLKRIGRIIDKYPPKAEKR